MATSKVSVTEGSGKNLATHSFSEDAVTKELSRIVPSTSAGADFPVGAGTAAAAQRVTLASDDPGVASLGVMDDWDRTDACKVVGTTVYKSVTLSLDTLVYAAGDVLADTQQVDAALRIADGTGVLQSITVFDLDNQAAYGFEVFVHQTSASMGTENAAISISAANAAAGILGKVAFSAADATDLINSKMYHRTGIGLPLKAVSTTDDIYISTVCRSGTPTHTAAGVIVILGILQD